MKNTVRFLGLSACMYSLQDSSDRRGSTPRDTCCIQSHPDTTKTCRQIHLESHLRMSCSTCFRHAWRTFRHHILNIWLTPDFVCTPPVDIYCSAPNYLGCCSFPVDTDSTSWPLPSLPALKIPLDRPSNYRLAQPARRFRRCNLRICRWRYWYCLWNLWN